MTTEGFNSNVPNPTSQDLLGKQKMMKKYDIIDQLMGSNREAQNIKNSFLKGLLSKSIDESIFSN